MKSEPPDDQNMDIANQVQKMAQASPAEALGRLKALQTPEANEPGDLHDEKLRWMFSILYHLDLEKPPNNDNASTETELVVYETKCTPIIARTTFKLTASVYCLPRVVIPIQAPLPHVRDAAHFRSGTQHPTVVLPQGESFAAVAHEPIHRGTFYVSGCFM